MGGKNEFFTAPGPATPATPGATLPNKIRIHESNGEVHFHDDNVTPRIKAAIAVAEFWRVWNSFNTSFEFAPVSFLDPKEKTQVTIKWVCVNNVWDTEVTVKQVELGENFKQIQSFINKQ